MDWLDISTYLVLNGEPVIIVFTLACIVSFAVIMMCLEDGTNLKKPAIILSGAAIIAMLGASTSMIPSHNKILEVKIERIKNEAVNKENIDKGIETLERIGKKLECKYLGGKECKEGK